MATAVPAHVLATLFPPERVRSSLTAREAWQPYPQAGDHAAWEALPSAARAQAIAGAEAQLGMSWPELPATLFLDFYRNGDRERYQQRHFFRRRALQALTLGECVEGKGRFLDDIINGLWAIFEESFWGVPAHNYSARPPFNGGHRREHAVPLGLPDTAYPVIDLFAAETAALLAWVWYLLGAQLTAQLPVVTERLEREINARILMPYRTNDTWWWLGKVRRTNNWNPWIHSNVLAVNLLMEPDTAVRAATVSQIIDGLDAFLATYHTDGGCDEGTSYWGRAGGSLFDNLDLLYRASKGQLDAFALPLVREIGDYIVRMHIGGPWYVNFADGAAKPAPNGTLISRYGMRTNDATLAQQGAYIAALAQGQGNAASPTIPAERRERLLTSLFRQNEGALTRLLPALFDPDIAAPDPSPALLQQSWLDGIEVLAAREHAGSTQGLFLAAKGGNNAESHNHNDVGNFIVALDGAPALIDIGVETYTRKTFSAQRYEIWTMRSSFHNVPLINGVEQTEGNAFAARDVTCTLSDTRAELSFDLAAAYPPAAGVQTWRRTLRLERAAPEEPPKDQPAAVSGTGNRTDSGAGRIVIEDAYTLANVPQSLALTLMTRSAADASDPGVLRCAGAMRPLLVFYDRQQFAAAVEQHAVTDERLGPVWGDAVYRVTLQARAPQATGRFTLTICAAGAS